MICKFLCQSKKPWARRFDFDRSFVYTQILYDLLRKNVYFDKFWNHATKKEEIVAMCELGKYPLRTSVGQMGK